jgi:ribonuclease R
MNDIKQLKEIILKTLKDNARAYNQEEFKELLNLEDFSVLSPALLELEKEMKVNFTNKGRYELYNNENLKTGKLTVNKGGFGFVNLDDMQEDAYINSKNLNKAISGDRVVVEIIAQSGVDLEGKIVRVLERNDILVGELIYKDGKAYVDIDDEKMFFDTLIPADKTMGAVTGHKVVVKLGKRINDKLYAAEVVKIIGHKNEPGVDIKSILPKHKIVEEFSPEALEEVKAMPTEVLPSDLVGRRDLRNEEIFTIDGDDTKDIDDAISIKKLPNGNYILSVHIADVTEYVKEGTALAKDAYERGTSHYLADRVVPMLPPELSNGICSLNPNVDRLCVSVDMEFDPKGKMVNYEFYESVIRSNIQMTYKKVNEIFSGKGIPEGYEKHADTLKTMLELSHIIRAKKREQGSIEFETTEAKIIVDKDGKAIDVIKRERGEGERLIEDFMIVANEAAANFAIVHQFPTLFRIHDVPKPERVDKFLTLVSSMGHVVNGKVRHQMHPKIIQQLNEELRKFDDYQILAIHLLRTMAKAVYSPNNIGHFGLAVPEYAHFTSPIRRMPDQFVHRIIKKILRGELLNDQDFEVLLRIFVAAGEHLSERERASDECEREVESMKKAEYMMDHIGEEFDGIITDVKNFGFFVSLDNTVDGLVKVDELKSGKTKYFFEERTSTLRADSNSEIYSIGKKVRVKVTGANKDERKVDFIIVKELEQVKKNN